MLSGRMSQRCTDVGAAIFLTAAMVSTVGRICPDGTALASGLVDETLRLADTETGRNHHIFLLFVDRKRMLSH